MMEHIMSESHLVTNKISRLVSVELKEGTLIGFKAAPGCSCDRLFANAQKVGNSDWSGIYVQLDIGQAVRYVPNQYDRGENIACVVALRVAKSQSLHVLVCSDPRMADTKISSAEKTNFVRELLMEDGYYITGDWEKPLVSGLGEKGYALCLIDSEDYELAVPHVLFNDNVLQAETIFTLPQSQRIPNTIGNIEAIEPNYQAVVSSVLKSMSKSDMADAAQLSNVLTTAMEKANVISIVTWFQA
jgi:hypothetical protein